MKDLEPNSCSVSYPSAASNAPAFESSCGRPGCTHSFRYDGGNPLDGIAALVKAHRANCVGRDLSATHPRTIHWEPSIQMVKQFPRAEYNAETSYFGAEYYKDEAHWDDCPQDKQDRDKANQKAMIATHRWDMSWTPTGGEMSNTRNVENKATMATCAPEFRFTCDNIETKLIESRHSSAANSVDEMMYGFGSEGPAETASCRGATARTKKPGAKKTARTEVERKAVLRDDPWTGLVEFYRVLCRGCGNTIKLDARSRYYPGLWLKHRKRCDGVRRGKPLLDAMISWDPKSARGSKSRDASETTDGSSMKDGSE
ncbi:hypothetical protein DFH07DRAFT_1054471, partial [Mycena maculata]